MINIFDLFNSLSSTSYIVIDMFIDSINPTRPIRAILVNTMPTILHEKWGSWASYSKLYQWASLARSFWQCVNSRNKVRLSEIRGWVDPRWLDEVERVSLEGFRKNEPRVSKVVRSNLELDSSYFCISKNALM